MKNKYKKKINNNNNNNNNNDDDDDDNAYSARSMHMHDQLSFTEVPKKYINANKKTKKLHSKKLVEIKNIYFQFNFTTCKSCPYVLRFFVPQLRDRKCKIPMHGSLMILYSVKESVRFHYKSRESKQLF